MTLFFAKSAANAIRALIATRAIIDTPRIYIPCARVGKFCHATCSFFSFPIFFFEVLAVLITSEMPFRMVCLSECTAKKYQQQARMHGPSSAISVPPPCTHMIPRLPLSRPATASLCHSAGRPRIDPKSIYYLGSSWYAVATVTAVAHDYPWTTSPPKFRQAHTRQAGFRDTS